MDKMGGGLQINKSWYTDKKPNKTAGVPSVIFKN